MENKTIDWIRVVEIPCASPDGRVVFGNITSLEFRKWLESDTANRERFTNHLVALSKDCINAKAPFQELTDKEKES